MSLPKYLSWYLHVYLKNNLLIIRNLLLFFFYYFSIPLHLRTLFAPWKRQVYSYKKPGFHPDEWMGIVFSNTISRFLGAIIRSATIFSGLTIIAMTLVISIPLIILLSLTPLLFLPIYWHILSSQIPLSTKLIQKSNRNLKKLLFSLLDTPEGTFLFERLGLSKNKLSPYFHNIYDQGDFSLFEHSLPTHQTPTHHLDIIDLIIALSHSYPPLTHLLENHFISDNLLKEAHDWYHLTTKSPQNSLLDLESLLRIPGIGRDWAFGYTVNLDKYSEDLSKKYTLYKNVYGRDKEIKTIETILSKTSQNSVVIVGEVGVGRHAIIYGLAKLIGSGWCLPPLFHKRIISLDIKSIMAEYKELTSAKEKINQLFDEARAAGNIILFIDAIEQYLSTEKDKIDLTQVFAENISDGRLQIISITDMHNYHHHLLPNQTVTNLFTKAEIAPPDEKTVLEELEYSIVPVLEQKYDIVVTLQSLKEIVRDAARYPSANPFPAKAIDLLDEVMVYVKEELKETYVTPHHIQEFISRKTKIPIGKITGLEKEKLLRLEELLHQQVINQEEAVSAIANSLRRRRTGVGNVNKPVGSFLFLGPTGVGKTETAKALARIYFGSEDKMIRFDMSQYQRDDGLKRLIGRLDTRETGELTKSIIDHPFSLLLLDEIEKADKTIYNLFLPLLDEGYIQDAIGRRIDAKNTIIIATSNAASEYIREIVLKGQIQNLKKDVIDYTQRKHIFAPEFLNRFDDVVVFTPLSEGHLREVAKLLLQKLNDQLVKQGYSLEITSDLVKKLTTIGYDPVFGGRALKRTISEKIENKIAQYILEGKLKRGQVININLD
ncbi:ATP-dependent Clp protease ATP-binding subunit [Candidatus Gottesmanbacteria bacterium]|nr:ATP-dependent Clp protease ATP-binding subunit [Candidatus Gottesmanbacteria bacterium]